MRFFLTRIQRLCRLMLAVWIVVFAFSVLAGCGIQDGSLGEVIPALAQSSPPHASQMQDGLHGSSHDRLCGKLCQNLSAPIVKLGVGVILLPCLLLGLTLWGLFACLWTDLSARFRIDLPPLLTGGSPPRPHLLFQRFNN
ncbi:hypothetical protein [Aquitalea pelogenes]|uniref:hypothetical protein n=1 Tax=Aquitalea pelogenes TaxID=1293573 RepID=UPI0035B1F84B